MGEATAAGPTLNPGLPRLLDLRLFVSAREAEITALVSSMKKAGQPVGAEALPRHLRRRATSHKPHSSRRRPNAKRAKTEPHDACRSGDNQFLSSVSKQARGRAASRRPGKLREMACSSAMDIDPSIPAAGASDGIDKHDTSPPRPEVEQIVVGSHSSLGWQHAWEQRASHELSGGPTQLASVRAGKSEGPGQATQRPRMLETHVWHSKRFKMCDMWGHRLAEGAVGKGRGRCAAVRSLTAGCVVHDSSYHSCLLLHGSELSLVSVLKRVSDPHTVPAPEESAAGIEHHIMIHRAGRWPHGALAPATATWLPSVPSSATITNPVAEREYSPEELGNPGYSCMLWVHCAAAAEVRQELEETATGHGVEVISASARLRRLELRGATATEVLTRALFGDQDPTLLGVEPGKEVIARDALVAALQDGAGLRMGQTATGFVRDPRLLRSSFGWLGSGETGELAAENSRGAPSGQTSDLPLPESGSQLPGLLHWAPLFLAPATPAAASEAEVSALRHHQRKQALHLTANEPGAISIMRQICPVALVKAASELMCKKAVNNSAEWSLLLPAGWVLPFWQALIMAGAKAAGLREWRWCKDEMGMPSFPRDYPDTPAGRSWSEDNARSTNKAPLTGQQPPSFRSTKWTVIRSAALFREFAFPATTMFPFKAVSASSSGSSADQTQGPCSAQEGHATRPSPPEASVADADETCAREAQLRAFLKPMGKGRPVAGAVVLQLPKDGRSHPPQRCLDDPADMCDPPIGIVTSEGAGGVGRDAFGASCLCLATSLSQLRAQQPPSSWHPGGTIQVAYQNPNSSAVRRGSLQICLELAELDCNPL